MVEGRCEKLLDIIYIWDIDSHVCCLGLLLYISNDLAAWQCLICQQLQINSITVGDDGTGLGWDLELQGHEEATVVRCLVAIMIASDTLWPILHTITGMLCKPAGCW